LPTQIEIAEACRDIQATWSDVEEQKRRTGPGFQRHDVADVAMVREADLMMV
jgi:hypothetical protein